jgi:hypothetical protein
MNGEGQRGQQSYISQDIGHILNDLRFALALALSEPIKSIAKHSFLQTFRVKHGKADLPRVREGLERTSR